MVESLHEGGARKCPEMRRNTFENRRKVEEKQTLPPFEPKRVNLRENGVEKPKGLGPSGERSEQGSLPADTKSNSRELREKLKQRKRGGNQSPIPPVPLWTNLQRTGMESSKTGPGSSSSSKTSSSKSLLVSSSNRDSRKTERELVRGCLP
jgi:hypothetical protein